MKILDLTYLKKIVKRSDSVLKSLHESFNIKDSKINEKLI